ncbi:EamA family transporter [Streptococcus iniae]|uniref:DMT family transporter n=1 Tax=Streptococcus iniae TaxID=1346 RepID=UPI0008DA70A7|nr:DMT family transporter [Streptococcus iniae]OHX26981.1 multidrug DMT transporter [Streptococcus iniae]RLV27220.1 EamA family transporter [Streptococcus iniae]
MTGKKGSIMVLIAGIAWGISGVSGQYLMAQGIDVNLLTSLRLLISGIVLCGFAYFKQRSKMKKVLTQKKILCHIMFFSVLGLLLNQYTYLNAIKYTNAGTATVLQYLSPVLILIFVTSKEKRWPSVAEAVAIVLAILGTVIIASHGRWDQLAVTPLGLFWGLTSAVTYAIYIILPARLIEEWGSLVVIGLAMLFAGGSFSLVTRPWNASLVLTFPILMALFGLIAIGSIFAYTVFLKGASLVGPVKGSLLASIEPVASVVFALVLLGDVFYPIDLLGMLLIMLAVFLISVRDLILLRREKAFNAKT